MHNGEVTVIEMLVSFSSESTYQFLMKFHARTLTQRGVDTT